MELVIPTPRVVLEENQGESEDTNNERRLADLEGVEEERAGQEKEPEVPAKNDQSICTSNTLKSVH